VRPAATGADGTGAARGYRLADTLTGPAPNSDGPTDYDLVGAPADCTGVHALDLLPRVDAVVLLGGAADRDPGPVALYAAERYCRRRRALLLVDPPAAWTMAGPAAARSRPLPVAGSHVVTYYPRLIGPDGSAGLSALGLVAAWLEGGGQRALPLRSAAPVAATVSAAEAAQLARHGVNALVAASGGIRLAGAVTLAEPGTERAEWRDLVVRQRALRLVDTLARATRWVLLQPRGPALWSALRAQVARFLADAEAAGWLGTPAAGRAWYVTCDADTHPRDGAPGFVVGLRCGAGLVVFRFVHTLAGCRVREGGWQPGASLAG
jgi:hypothetical protein